MVNFFLLILSFFGWKPKETAREVPQAPPPRAVARPSAPMKTDPQRARDAIDVLGLRCQCT
jgi:hypothetical protein